MSCSVYARENRAAVLYSRDAKSLLAKASKTARHGLFPPENGHRAVEKYRAKNPKVFKDPASL